MGFLLPQFIVIFVLTVQLFYAAHGSIHYYEFILKETNFTKLCLTKTAMTVNDSFPGPEIRVHKGDTVFVHVRNIGDFGATIHWHGVKQPRNPWSDGPEYITQCAIQPGSNFTYEIDFTEEEGTLWWHAHSDWTRATVHGAIVILPAEGTTYPFPQPDEEVVIVIASWYVGNLRELLFETIKEGTHTPLSDAYTINGEAGDLCPCSSDTTYRKVVDYGKTYLLRFINAANNADMFLAIADHNVTVVGTDGAYIKPIVTSYIKISTGQTMDVLVTANQSASHYYMATRQYSNSGTNLTEFDHANATAIFQYSGNYTAPDSPYFPTTLPPYKDYDASFSFTNRFRSLANQDHPINVPLNITTKMMMVASMGFLYCESCGWAAINRPISSINNLSWVDPSTDILQAYYRNMSGIYKTGFPDRPPNFYNFTGDDLPINDTIPATDTRVKVLEYGESVEIVYQGTNVINASESHPMHLHGHSFYVVGSGHGNFDSETDPKGYNLIDPPYLNTASVPARGWATIRFRATNPGVWLMHCHYDRHFTWGMNTVFIVKNGGTTATTIRPRPSYMPPCEGPDANLSQPLGTRYISST